MRVVYEAANLIDAHLVKQALEQADLPAWIRGEALTGGMGDLGVFGLVAVMVPDDCIAPAQVVLSALALGEVALPEAGEDDLRDGLPA